jgi:ABC-2 type transport system ATP-binding protein
MTVLVSTHYMDEAERCDQIVYIAYGNLMAQGRVEDIIDQSGLHTFVAEGTGVRELMERLRGQPGADHVAYFGNALHVSGGDEAALKRLVDAHQVAGVKWHEERPNLEDVFIHLMGQSTDNSTGA